MRHQQLLDGEVFVRIGQMDELTAEANVHAAAGFWCCGTQTIEPKEWDLQHSTVIESHDEVRACAVRSQGSRLRRWHVLPLSSASEPIALEELPAGHSALSISRASQLGCP